ncbi:MAG: mechanosensitive ion channel [Clostridia bacterium]|nr:mechanosensitive ion channel [Clostridia bacterium]
MNWENFFPSLLNWLTTEGLKIVFAIIVILVGFFIVGKISKKIANACEKKGTDKMVAKILVALFNYGLKGLIVICMLGYLGIETSSIAAVISAVGIAVGLAVQGALSNFAGGILIILTHPFKLDEFIETQGISGTVENIGIIHTTVRTGDNRTVILPNGALANSNVINYSRKDIRRVDFTFSISYDSDFALAQKIILDVFEKHEKVLGEPGAMVRMTAHGQNSIDLVSRCWTNASDYWDVYFDITETIKAEFDKNGIQIPYSQLDVHVSK